MVRISNRADVRGIGWKLAGYIEARRHKHKHLASTVKVSCVFRAGCPSAPLVPERRIEGMYQNGTGQIEGVRDLEACTYHAVDNNDVR